MRITVSFDLSAELDGCTRSDVVDYVNAVIESGAESCACDVENIVVESVIPI